ncbi:MAG: tRNA pseudouridine(38-40) synthase TruA [Myxococcales bacterium]|nr:MAG: tRNA pseudouridine(38-40) synthase TruA [Myxococcales bacterium]
MSEPARPGSESARPTGEQQGVLLTIAYDGGPFHGWAIQRNAVSVGGVLLAAIHKIRPGVRELFGASRTDAGVHARCQKVSFDAAPGVNPRGWALGLNSFLPPTIAVRAASHVPAGYDTRFHGRGKRYVYTVLADRLRDPLHEGHSWRVPARLDPVRMQEAARHLLGTHDFRAFRAAADMRTDTTRTLRRVELHIDPLDPRLMRLIVEGDRFMYNMVRIIAGTLVDVGAGRRSTDATAEALRTGDRERLGQTAPAAGLLLDEVMLDTEGDDLWPPPGTDGFLRHGEAAPTSLRGEPAPTSLRPGVAPTGLRAGTAPTSLRAETAAGDTAVTAADDG